MYRRIISIIILMFMAVTSITFFFIALAIWGLTILFDRRLVLLHKFTSLWAAIYVWIVPAWKVKVIGKENIDKNQVYVIVSNHQSQLDILVSFTLFFHFKWVSKAEVFKVPFMGWNMFLNRYIRLVRGDRKGVKNMLLDCEKTLANGSSVFIFPEGTRSIDGSIGKFSGGAFSIAKKRGLPILPIAINGTSNALPKNSLNFHGTHQITLSVLPPVAIDEIKEMNNAEAGEYVRDRISVEVERLKEGC